MSLLAETLATSTYSRVFQRCSCLDQTILLLPSRVEMSPAWKPHSF